MSKTQISFYALAIALLVVAAVMLGSNIDRSDSQGSNGSPDREGNARSAKSARTIRVAPDPRKAARDLRSLLQDLPASGHSFEEIERLVRQLSDEDLHGLIALVGFDEWNGMTGWIRCAHFAEWGRREPDATAECLAIAGSGDDSTCRQQAIYSFFRGKIEGRELNSDLVREIEEEFQLSDNEDPFASPLANIGGWIRRDLFRAFARTDPEAAWREATARPDTYALEGFFLGLAGAEEVRHYAGEWQREWEAPEARQSYANYIETITTTTFHVPEPPLERVGEAAALALAEHDLREAEAWLTAHAPGTESQLGTRRYVVQSEWAKRNLDAALALLSNAEFADAHHGLASGILYADATRVVEVIAALEDVETRRTALSNALSTASTTLREDAFPTPGGVNRLPNFQERHDALREAIEAGGFDERTRARLLDQLGRGFRHLHSGE